MQQNHNLCGSNISVFLQIQPELQYSEIFTYSTQYPWSSTALVCESNNFNWQSAKYWRTVGGRLRNRALLNERSNRMKGRFEQWIGVPKNSWINEQLCRYLKDPWIQILSPVRCNCAAHKRLFFHQVWIREWYKETETVNTVKGLIFYGRKNNLPISIRQSKGRHAHLVLMCCPSQFCDMFPFIDVMFSWFYSTPTCFH